MEVSSNLLNAEEPAPDTEVSEPNELEAMAIQYLSRCVTLRPFNPPLLRLSKVLYGPLTKIAPHCQMPMMKMPRSRTVFMILSPPIHWRGRLRTLVNYNASPPDGDHEICVRTVRDL